MLSVSRYPPIGTRSVGIARAQGIRGCTLQDYIENADDRLTTSYKPNTSMSANTSSRSLTSPVRTHVFIVPYVCLPA